MTDPNPPETVPEAPGTSAPAGTGNESTPPAAMSLADINKATGRNYANLDEALKGVAATYSHVGKPPEVREVVKEVVKIPDNVVTREEFDKVQFLASNPDANKHKEFLEQTAKANGLTVQEVFNGDPATVPAAKFFKDTVAKLNVAEETANTRSALTSSPRLGIVSDASTKAKEAFEGSQKARASGDMMTAATLQREAEKSALDAVIKGFGLADAKITD